jgi:hypothetical protein
MVADDNTERLVFFCGGCGGRLVLYAPRGVMEIQGLYCRCGAALELRHIKERKPTPSIRVGARRMGNG